MSNRLVINEQIGGTQCRLIDENGAQQGIKSMREALWYARSVELDLVKIADANPPVCKVVDASKYQYQLQKQQQELAKKQRANAVNVKEVQLRPGTGINDVKIKARKAKEFLSDGDKVKVVVRFRGRERTMKHLGHEVINTFINEIGEVKTDRSIAESGNELSVILVAATPKPKAA